VFLRAFGGEKMQTEMVSRSDDGDSLKVAKSSDIAQVQSEIESLDREWNQISAKLMVRDLIDGSQVPRKDSVVVSGFLMVFISLLVAAEWWICLSTPPVLFAVLFPLSLLSSLLPVIGLTYFLYIYVKAIQYNRVFDTYQAKRVWLEAKRHSRQP
jgi:hypothetical protein